MIRIKEITQYENENPLFFEFQMENDKFPSWLVKWMLSNKKGDWKIINPNHLKLQIGDCQINIEWTEKKDDNKISLAELINEYDGTDRFSINDWEIYDINHFQTTLRICAFKTFDINDDKIVQVKE